MKRSLLALAFLLIATPAFAVCPATLQLKDNAGATPTAKYTDDGSGNCMANIAVQDGADATQGAKADAVASTDTGTFSLTALIKRLNQSITALIAAVNSGVSTLGSAPPSTAIQISANASGATGGLARSVTNCDQHVFLHITTATDTLITQGVTGQTVYVCGATAQAAGTATFFLENTASTNANCASANTQIAGLTTMAANGQYGFYNPMWGGLKNTAANGLCVNSTGTGGFDLDVWFAKF